MTKRNSDAETDPGAGDRWQQARTEYRSRQADAIASAALSLVMDRGASALTMATIADAAGISRQTLYRYYRDVDALLVGIAELVASHDDHVDALVLEQSGPGAQLDAIVRTAVHGREHHRIDATTLRATLPPQAREVLTRHEDRIVRLLAGVLGTGIDEGVFRGDLEPSADAPLILGLALAGDPSDPERAISLVHRLVDPDRQEIPT